MDKRAFKTYNTTICQMAIALKYLIGDLLEDETEAAKNKELSDDDRRKARRRASLLQNTYAAAFNVIEAIADINKDPAENA